MATQTDVNSHKNQRHSLHYPLGSPGSYADEKVRVCFLYQYTRQLAIFIYYYNRVYIYQNWSNGHILGANGI